MQEQLPDTTGEPLKTIFKRLLIVIIFGIAFAYIEAAVVVYLRAIFHPDGFSFPLTESAITSQGKELLLTEVGRETATIVLILTGAWLFGRGLQQQFAYSMTIFAVWDIFYYVWLKVLLGWPASILDWDILFLIPRVWAGPVLAPVLISLTMLMFAVIILYRCCGRAPIKATVMDWLGFVLVGVVVVASFCIAGAHSTEADYRSHFHWPLYGVGHVAAIALFLKCLAKSR
jgi:hypothetical protein